MIQRPPSTTRTGTLVPDTPLFRSVSERTFQQIAQVSGRAGRGQKPGRVFIQTRSPATPVIKALVHNDSEGFYSAETESRRRAHAPPFGRFAAIVVYSEKPEDAQETARLIGRSEENTSEIQPP